MSIVASVYAPEAHTQADGRRYVLETHTYHLGGTYQVAYLASDGADYAGIMASRVPGIEEQLAEQEYQANLANDTATLQHITGAQLLARVREAYRSASREELARLATWIINRVNAGDVTDTQLRNAFGLTVTQYNALKARMVALRDGSVDEPISTQCDLLYDVRGGQGRQDDLNVRCHLHR